MNVRGSLWGAGIILAALVSCAGPTVRYDFDAANDFSAYRTYGWQAPSRAAGGGGTFDTPIMEGRLQRAVDQELAARGFLREGGAAPDFLVTSYPIRQSVRGGQPHLGVGLGMGPLGVGVGAPVGQPRRASVGSVVLEVRDGRTRAVVWKATAEGALDSSDTPEEADAAVDRAIRGMLRKFPPKRS